MTVTKKAILAEYVKRKDAIKNTKKVVLADNFPEQNAFINDKSKFVVAQCSRRSGKTNGLVLRFFKTMERYPNTTSVYLAHTRTSAKEIIWQVLKDHAKVHGIECKFNVSNLEMTHPNGAKLNLYGADMENFMDRLRGQKWPAVAIDEAQSFGPHLQALVDDIVTPALMDYEDGWLAITGTPGAVPKGYFFDITEKGKYGYSKHSWTLLENPYIPNARKQLDDLLAKREWTEANPTYLREYRNQWVLDLESLWIRYSAEKCDYDTMPMNHNWTYVMGIDIGFKDADAIAIVAYSDTCPDTYLVEEVTTRGQDITSLVESVRALQAKYDVAKMVMDEGALGKKIGEEIRRRFQLPIVPAVKQNKQDNVALLNDAMRLGRFKAKANSRFAVDSFLIQIDWEKSRPDRIIIKKHNHSDIIDAVLYAFKESYAFSYTNPPPPPPKWGSQEWLDAQSDEMFEAAVNHFNRLKDEENGEF